MKHSKKQHKKIKSKFFRIFDIRLWFMDLSRLMGVFNLWTFLLPKYHYENGAKGIRHSKGKKFVASNHTSWADPLMMLIAFPWRRVFIVMAREIFGSGFKKRFYQSIGCIPVNRERPNLASFKGVTRRINEERVVGIFPEGRMNVNDNELMDFKHGAAYYALKTGTDITPIYFYGRYRFFRRNHVMIGNPIDVKPYLDGKITEDKIAALTDELKSRIQQLKEQLEAVVDPIYEKRASKNKKTPKEGK